MNSFAQTGAGQDDLFDDFTNGEESMQTRAQDDLFGDDFTPATEEQIQAEAAPAPSQEFSTRGRGGYPRGPGRGRGRGRGDSARPNDRQGYIPQQPRAPKAQQWQPPAYAAGTVGLLDSKHGPASAGPLDSKHAETPSAPSQSSTPTVPSQVGLLESKHAPQPEAQSAVPDVSATAIDAPESEAAATTAPEEATPTPSSHPPNAPTAPRVTKPQSVRGDRLATGGNQRTKLTEEELSARMESVRLKNTRLEEAHARAQADADSFAARETEAAAKRQVERRDRQQMMGEREKNRQRKLKAQEGREWDSEKREEDFADRRRGVGRGAHGGVVGTRLGEEARGPREVESDGREYLYREDAGRGRGRGAAGRGRGGTGRQGIPRTEDFPALAARGEPKGTANEEKAAPALSFPSGSKAAESSETKDTLADAAGDGGKGKTSWADMVEETKA